MTKLVPEGVIVGGNLARILSYTDQYIKKHKAKMFESHVYEREWTIPGDITLEMSRLMADELNNEVGYVK
ncbi:hypothetical protein ABFG93_14180 [Pseudalkalibacillus hwajinpoensis]|uniref:hypothetical protein n=1 Tax=Guptibacillus hwajinpoensis TaxID=208199 RepID=UPI00325B97D0